MGELVKNRGTPHRLGPLDFTTSSATKSLAEFHQPATVEALKMIMINGL